MPLKSCACILQDFLNNTMWKTVALCLLFGAVFSAGAGRLPSKTPSDVRKAVFQNYDSRTTPLTSPNQPVPVSSALNPIFIRELDEEKEILILDAWLYVSWIDKRLTWNPENFSDITHLTLPVDDFWKPDITTYTASPDVKLLPTVFTNAILNNSGGVIWVPPLTIYSRCPLKMENYPYDVQHCEIKLGSWTMGSKSINLELFTEKVPLENFMNSNPIWSLEKASVTREEKYYPCCPDESYATLQYNITMKRRPVSAICISNVVSMIATWLGVLMFFLPSDSTQKFLLGALAQVLLVADTLFLNLAVHSPGAKFRASERVYPYMIAVALFLIFEVITVNMARRSGPCRPPRCLVAVSRMFCQPLEACAAVKDAYGEMDGEKFKNSVKAQDEWKTLATALDRILLFIALGVSILLFKLV